jgi:hypothetical protein
VIWGKRDVDQESGFCRLNLKRRLLCRIDLMFVSFRRKLTLLLILPVLAGCGGKNEAIIVKGVALYRGQPLSGGTVTFCPNPDRGFDGPILQGTVLEDGSFELQPLEGTKIRAGWYRVAIAPRAGSQDFPTPENPYPGLPLQFRNPKLSGLEKEIKQSGENIFHFDLGDS